MGDVVVAPRWWLRLASAIRAALPGPALPGIGVAMDEGIAAPGYPTMSSLSAMAAFPWVRACARAIYTDLSGLPLRAVEREPGEGTGGGRILGSHATIDLLRRPAPQVSGRRLRRQLYLDLVLAGNAFIWQVPPGLFGPGSMLLRLHPNRVDPDVGPLGLIRGYRVDGLTRILLPEEVLHVADASWTDDASAVLGEGAIRSLHDDLTAEKAAKELAQTAARRGRLEFLLSPKDSSGGFGQEVADKISARFEERRMIGRSVVTIGEALEAKQLSLTPRDMEFADMRRATIEATLAVFGVPPVRVGLPGANYGTARQQMRTYWEGLQGLAVLFDDELSQLTGRPDMRIEHDFSGVDSLQTSRTERQLRAATWISAFGAEPAAAAGYEGFDQAPVGDVPEKPAAPARPEQPPEEGQERGGLAHEIEGLLLRASVRAQLVAEDGEELEPVEEIAWWVDNLGPLLGRERAGAWGRRIALELVESVAAAELDESTGFGELEAFSAARAGELAVMIDSSTEAQ